MTNVRKKSIIDKTEWEIAMKLSLKSMGLPIFGLLMLLCIVLAGCSGDKKDESDGESASIDDFYYEKNESGYTIIGVKDNGKITYTIPDSVTAIGDMAFYQCEKLLFITIPDSVTSIGEKAFADCRSLNRVMFYGNVKSIGDRAFSYCRNIVNITLPDGLENIGNGAFESCRSLTKITMPDGLVSIGDEAFSFCEALESVTIPGSVTKIGEYAFDYCHALEGVRFENTVGWIANETELELTNPTRNATYLNETYDMYDWVRR